MSNLISEQCLNCLTDVMPIDTMVPVDDSEYGTYGVKIWRYKCECGYIWANELQRKHNATAHRKARKKHEYFSR